jgi:hypothetical protein
MPVEPLSDSSSSSSPSLAVKPRLLRIMSKEAPAEGLVLHAEGRANLKVTRAEELEEDGGRGLSPWSAAGENEARFDSREHVCGFGD